MPNSKSFPPLLPPKLPAAASSPAIMGVEMSISLKRWGPGGIVTR